MAQNKATKQKMFWFDNLLGMNQRQNWDVIPLNTSPLLQNITLDRIGSWGKRDGTDLLATTQAGNGVYGLHEYISYTQEGVLRAVRSQDLDTYNFTNDLYTELDALQFTASTKVQSVNFLNRAYHTSTADYLCYEDGSGVCTNVGATGNEIKAGTIAVAQNTLFVGDIRYIGGTGIVSDQDRVYYSFFDNDNQVPSHQLYDNESGSNTLATSTRYFTVLAPVRGLFSYGLSNRVHIFTANKCYEFDIGQENNAVGPKWLFDIGLANPRAITTCNGWLIWMDATGRIWGWNGSSYPTCLSFALEDDSRGESVIGAMDKSVLTNVCAGSLGNKFYFSIGNITYFGETLSNVVMVGFMMPDMSNVLWSLYTLPVRPTIFSNATYNGNRYLVFGSLSVDDVYRLEIGTNDVGSSTTPITAKAKTAFTDFKYPLYTKNATELWVKFRPQSVNNTYLKVSYAIDGNFSYTAITDPDNAGETDGGVIDMYNPSSSTKTDDVVKIKIPGGVRFRTISIQIENSQANEDFEISGIGIMYTLQSLDLTYNAT